MQALYTLAAALGSFALCEILTHPNAKIRKKSPNIRIKWLELMPSIRILTRKRVIHIHHWVHLSLLLVVSFVFIQDGILSTWTAKGAMLGGVLQGLRFPDRGIVYPRN